MIEQAVKGTYEHNGQSYQAYWNGKTYGTKRYVTVTFPSGKQTKVTFDGKCVDFGNLSTFSMDQAKAALRSVGIIE